MGFTDSSVDKESTCNAGDPGSIPGLGRSAGEEIGYSLQYSWASLVAQLVKNLPAMQETWVWSLGWRDPLKKGKATHSSILGGEFQGLDSPWGHKESDMTEWLSLPQVQSLGWEDSLEKGMATHSSILAWRILWTEKPEGLQSMGSQTVGHDWATNTHTCIYTHIYMFINTRMFSWVGLPAGLNV